MLSCNFIVFFVHSNYNTPILGFVYHLLKKGLGSSLCWTRSKEANREREREILRNLIGCLEDLVYTNIILKANHMRSNM